MRAERYVHVKFVRQNSTDKVLKAFNTQQSIETFDGLKHGEAQQVLITLDKNIYSGLSLT